jgi:hypothetical protein
VENDPEAVFNIPPRLVGDIGQKFRKRSPLNAIHPAFRESDSLRLDPSNAIGTSSLRFRGAISRFVIAGSNRQLTVAEKVRA